MKFKETKNKLNKLWEQTQKNEIELNKLKEKNINYYQISAYKDNFKKVLEENFDLNNGYYFDILVKVPSKHIINVNLIPILKTSSHFVEEMITNEEWNSLIINNQINNEKTYYVCTYTTEKHIVNLSEDSLYLHGYIFTSLREIKMFFNGAQFSPKEIFLSNFKMDLYLYLYNYGEYDEVFTNNK